MNRQEQIQKLFDEFKPFVFKKDEQVEMDKTTMDFYQPFLDKLNRTEKVKLIIEPLNTDVPIKNYELDVTDGLKRYILNLIEFDNKIKVESSSHATDRSLEEESEKRLNLFLSTLFNRRLPMIFECGGLSEDNDYFDYNLWEVYYDGENSFHTSWINEDQENLTFIIID